MLKGTKERFIHSKNASSPVADGSRPKRPQPDFQAHRFFQNTALPIKRRSLFLLARAFARASSIERGGSDAARLGHQRPDGLARLPPGCSVLESSAVAVGSTGPVGKPRGRVVADSPPRSQLTASITGRPGASRAPGLLVSGGSGPGGHWVERWERPLSSLTHCRCVSDIISLLV